MSRTIRSFGATMVVVGAAALAAAHAQVVEQITHVATTVAGPGALDDAGTMILAGVSADYGSNPRHTFQIVRFDPSSGVTTPLTAAVDGASAVVSVSDDGQWLAFPSPTDLTGGNHDESIELFVMSANGATIAQLTSDPAPNAGSVGAVSLSGDGSRVAFVANTDPLGQNPDHNDELFIVDRQGTNLAQLTVTTAGAIGGISISDDAARIVFTHDGDLTGGNPDLGPEVFAIDADGTGLRQLTATPAGFGSSAPALSGNGATVAFQSNGDLTGGNAANQTEIFVIGWNGSGLAQVTTTGQVLGLLGEPASQAPSITDDGQTIVFQSNHSHLFAPTINLDGNYEIFKIGANGTGLTALTNTLLELGSLLPVVSGSGNRVAYYGVDTDIKLQAMDGSGGTDRDLLVMDLTLYGGLDLTADGSRAVFVRATGLFGVNQLFRVETDGSDLAQITTLADGGAASPSIAADGATIVFSTASNPDGVSNPDLSEEIFRVDADGTGLVQLTSGPDGTASQDPVIAASGARVVFESTADLTGGNADLSVELFAMDPDGTDLVQLTDSGLDGTAVASRGAAVDAAGVWVAFESSADLDGSNADGSFEIWRIGTDGTGLERITGDTIDSGGADISADGGRVAFASGIDPLGSNPEGNSEIFLYDISTASLVQLTSFAEGDSGGVALSGDGAWVYFSSNSPVLEDDPDRPTDFYRVPASGGPVERVGALRRGALGGLALPGTGGAAGMVTDDTGDTVVFSGLGDFTEENPDLLPEIWAIRRTIDPALDVGRASPTVLSWTHGSGPLRYDMVRGDVAALGDGPGDTVDLGPVTCLEDDSPDADTIGFEDGADPLPGQAFFFVYRGSQGILDGPGTYGTSDDGRLREVSAGDCAP